MRTIKIIDAFLFSPDIQHVYVELFRDEDGDYIYLLNGLLPESFGYGHVVIDQYRNSELVMDLKDMFNSLIQDYEEGTDFSELIKAVESKFEYAVSSFRKYKIVQGSIIIGGESPAEGGAPDGCNRESVRG